MMVLQQKQWNRELRTGNYELETKTAESETKTAKSQTKNRIPVRPYPKPVCF